MSIIENRLPGRVFLLLLESPEQYDAYKARKESFGAHELVICCLSVAASSYCKKNKLHFMLPEDSYTDEECDYYRNLSEKKIRNLVKHLNDYYQEKTGNRDGFLFDMGNYHFFMLYHFFGALHHRAFFLWKVIEKHNVDRILIPEESTPTSTVRLFPVSQYVNCYLDLCQNSVYRDKVIRIPVVSIMYREHATLRRRVRRTISKTLRKFKVVNDYLNRVQSNIPVKFLKLFLERHDSDILLVGGSGPWKYVFSDTRITSRVNVFNEPDGIDLSPASVKNWFKEWFDWEDKFCGFTVSSLGYYEMARIKIMSEQIIASHPKTVQIVKQKKALIYSVAPYATQQYYLSVAKHFGLPCVCFQHGEMSLYYNGLWDESSELLYVSHYFSYGEQVSIEKKSHAANIMGIQQAVSIGSPALDKIKESVSSGDGEYILYASSKYVNYGCGFISRYADVAVSHCQGVLISYFEQYIDSNPGFRVVWKLNQEHLTEQPSVLTRKVEVIRDKKTFTDLLADSRAVILDRPSTTSIEACMTDKPLFVLLANRNWYSLPEELLRKRAVIAYTPEELCKAVDEYLTKGVYPADVYNREFVRAYGCHLDDGLSSQRAADELLEIMGENSLDNFESSDTSSKALI